MIFAWGYWAVRNFRTQKSQEKHSKFKEIIKVKDFNWKNLIKSIKLIFVGIKIKLLVKIFDELFIYCFGVFYKKFVFFTLLSHFLIYLVFQYFHNFLYFCSEYLWVCVFWCIIKGKKLFFMEKARKTIKLIRSLKRIFNYNYSS